MISGVNLHDVLQQGAEVVARTLNAERATVYHVLKDTQELESVAVIGNVLRAIRTPICGSSLVGYCALSRTAFIVPDAYGDLSIIGTDLHFDKSWDKMNQFHTRDVMCVPAIFNDELLGVVQTLNSKSHPFGETCLVKLKIISRLISYALFHAKLYDELATLKCLKKQKAQFMRIMVHELKSPVAGSKMLLTGLLYTSKEDPKISSVLTKISKRMDDLLAMVEDILHLSRVQEGEPLGEIGILDLVPITRKECEPYVEQAKAKGLLLTVGLPEITLRTRFDFQGYKLVLSNLLSNAVKYTPEGSVDVRLFQEGDKAVLRVKDTGIGIPKQDIPKMFQEFFRASNVRGGSIKGTGVGLAGVKEIVTRFGGELELESKEGKGTEFTVRFPLNGSQ